ncbi:ABC transporter substrate-binding protein [Amycolatopsis acidicola]|uniref:ABC transporter substrate-binding protein n=1 Tax=Amycolatopsis acidicola TaxID=2596893 RepID=A0A5N0UZ33_9PSEU|nr:ABC transporter substrate-binding protein [Amycolatopsis acidicola]KAA9158272.1 ABC transporter substrate-binding protein [Amycolatopsis acidicola]
MVSRRTLLQAGAGLAVAGPLAACSSGLGGSGSGGDKITIGFVSPRTGSTAGFGEPDGYVLDQARKALSNGLSLAGKTYSIEIVDKDSQSNPQRSAQVTNDLINSNGVDLVLATSTPETVNPASDACEAAGVPCISTIVPWEAWYFGRGAKEGEPSPFKFTYHFSFGVEQFHKQYTSLWSQVPTNKKVGVMWPNDADGNAIRKSLGPLLQKEGYTIVDPGAYTDGTNDFSSQIARFKAENCEVFNTFPLPPDFATFWQQAAQQGYRPKIAQIAKTGLFVSQVEALGPSAVGLAGGTYWSPTFPYRASLTGVTSKELGDGYTAATGKQWNQQLGPSTALFDVAVAALKGTPNPKDKAGLAKTVSTLSTDTVLGRIAFGTGPVPNVVPIGVHGGQWRKATTGQFPLEFLICENANDPNVPVATRLQPYA